MNPAAPVSKILMSRTKCSRPGVADDPVSRFGERGHAGSGFVRRPSFRIAAIDPDGEASGRGAGIHVAPAVANHEALAQIDFIFAGGFEEESGLGLATVARVRILVIADEELVDRQRLADGVMYLLDFG